MATGVDIDNVLAATDASVLWRLNKRFGTRFRPEQLTNYLVERSLDLTNEQLEFVQGLFASPEFYRSIRPVRRAAEGLQLIADGDDVVYVSSRPLEMADVTVEWLDVNGFPVGAVHLGALDKGEVALRERCEAFVEDQPEHAMRVGDLCNIPVYVLAYPWNAHVQGAHVRRVAGWGEIIRIIQEEAAR